MTSMERNEILETADILRTLGGSNGFSNLQPKVRKVLLQKANRLDEIVKRDIRGGTETSETVEIFEGETVYED